MRWCSVFRVAACTNRERNTRASGAQKMLTYEKNVYSRHRLAPCAEYIFKERCCCLTTDAASIGHALVPRHILQPQSMGPFG